MAQMKINTSVGSVIDPTKGLQTAMSSVADIMKMKQDAADSQLLLNRQAKLDAEKQQELQYQHGRQAVLDGYAKMQNDHANTLYDEKQNEYNRKVNNRNILNTIAQNPDTANASDVGKTQTDALVQNHFAQGNAAAEAKIKALGLDANNGDGEQIGKIYNQANYGTTDPMKIDLMNRQVQGEYDNNKLTREDGKKILEKQIVIAGGDLTNPATQSYVKDTIGALPTRASLVTADAKAADEANKAAQQVIKNRIELEKIKQKGIAAENKGSTMSTSSPYGKNKASYGRHIDPTKMMSEIDAMGLSPHPTLFGIPLAPQIDVKEAKNAATSLLGKGYSASDIVDYLVGQTTYGTDTDNGKIINGFNNKDVNSILTLDNSFKGFLKKKREAILTRKANSTSSATKVTPYTAPKNILRYTPQRGMSYQEIQAAQDKASADRIAALFGAPAKTVKKNGGTKTKGGSTGGTSGGIKKVLKTNGGTGKPVLAPATQLGSADRLQEMADARQASKTATNQNADLLKKVKDVPRSKTNSMLKLVDQIDNTDKKAAVDLPKRLFKTAQKINNTGYLSRKILADKAVDQGTKNTQSKMDKKLSRIMQLTRSSDFSKAYNRLSSPEKKRLKKLLGR